ncbi:MAG: tetratricopeptide repeat protein, partial [Vallitaleaceae bacterium]|nr:tetratricopeptide repeat protein [Vallitaleaceae bacterium]
MTEDKPGSFGRFIAKLFDYYLVAVIISMLLWVWLERGEDEAIIAVFVSPINYFLILLITSMLYEILMISYTGTTIGKSLMGIRILDAEENHLLMGQSFVRTLSSFAMGRFFCIPILSIIALTRSFRTYAGTKEVKWDRNYQVEQFRKGAGPWVTILTIVLFSVSVVTYVYMTEALKLEPPEVTINELFEADEYEAIIQYLDGYLDASSGTASLYNWYGYAYMQLDQYEEAISRFETGLELDEEDDRITSMLYSNISWADYVLGDYDLALTYADLAIAYDSANVYGYINKGNIHSVMGNPSEAESA